MTLTTWRGDESLAQPARLLEASAGTGKTWQIAHLVTRWVAEDPGVPIERLLVITFTNAAAAELRDRVRRRLIAARDRLRDESAAGDAPGDAADPMLAALAAVEPQQRRRRLGRLEQALSSFDLAPISTIHGFSQRTLSELAFASGQEPGLELLQDLAPVLRDQVLDALARARARASDAKALSDLEAAGFTEKRLSNVAKAAAAAVAPRLLPATVGEPEQARSALAAALAAPKHPEDDTRSRNALQQWLQSGAPREGRFDKSGKPRAFVQAFALRGGDPDASPVAKAARALFDVQDAALGHDLTEFARDVRAAVERELQRRGALSFDAMLTRMAERIESEGKDGPLARAVAERYDVALVDEFQDTDAAQWAVLDAVFRRAGRRLLMIGDPKQAIYAFRGADVFVYERASRGDGGPAPMRSTMRQNHRTDAALLASMNGLWGGAREVFGEVSFDYVEVEAPAYRVTPASRLVGRVRDGADDRPRAPLELRWLSAAAVEADGDPAEREDQPIGTKELARALTAALCAEEVVGLLDGDQMIGEPLRVVRPNDIAILVRTHGQASACATALRARGVPVVATGRTKVVESVAVDWLLTWLDAIAAPADEACARALALSPLGGWTPAELDAALQDPDATAWDSFRSAITRATERYARGGFFRAFDRALEEAGGLGRLLQFVDGERHATDVRHLIELLHREERRARPSPAGLAAWLRQRRAAGGEGDEDEQRLESDARAVQIVTIHRSKGLEYPIVLLPFAWERPNRRGEVRFHDAQGRLCLDLHPNNAPARAAAETIAEREHEEEQMRLLYVATTRAAQHLVVWHGMVGRGGAENALDGAMGRLLFGAVDGGSLAGLARARAAEVGAGFRLELPPAQRRWRDPTSASTPVATPRAEPLRREQWTDGWQLTSYTGIARALPQAHGAGGVETIEQVQALAIDARALRAADNEAPEEVADPDAAADEVGAIAGDRRLAAAARADLPAGLREAGHLADEPPLASMLRGKDVGVWAHAVLEHLDFASGRGEQLIARDGEDAALLVERLANRHGITDPRAATALHAALPGIVTTPLCGGKLAVPEGFCLADLADADRVDEWGFDLGIGGGADVRVRSAQVAAALARTRDLAPKWDGLPWLDALLQHPDALFPRIHGVLTGFVDLCFRFHDDAGVQRYVICDYKTNRLSLPGDRRRSPRAAYGRESLAAAMAEHHYPLQALLYTVALHRLLRLRLGAAYDPEQQLGGYAYLFVRGMEGPQTERHRGTALGVYTDRWPTEVVLALDAALEGERQP